LETKTERMHKIPSKRLTFIIPQ